MCSSDLTAEQAPARLTRDTSPLASALCWLDSEAIDFRAASESAAPTRGVIDALAPRPDIRIWAKETPIPAQAAGKRTFAVPAEFSVGGASHGRPDGGEPA